MIAAVTMSAAGARAAEQPPGGRLANAPVLVPVADDPTVSFSIAFRTGAQDDPTGKEGLAYLTACLMAEGATVRHTYPEILRLLYPMATTYDVRVDKELTTFSGRAHRDNVDAFASLLLEAVVQPAFSETDFVRLKQRTIDAIAKTLRYASDEELGKAILYDSVFAGTPYGHLNLGTIAGLKAISLEDVRALYRARFTRDDVILAVGGGFEPGLVSRLSSTLATLPAGTPATVPAPRPARLAGRRVEIVTKPGSAIAISFGFPIPVRRGSRDFYALWLANSWFGEHRNSSSHLYQVIREARGMNYGDYSYIEVFPEGGRREFPPTGVPRRQQLFEVWVRPVPNGQAHFALRAAVRELERLVAHGLSEEQFRLTQSFVSKYCLHYAETTQAVLGYALDDRIIGIGQPGHLENFGRIIPTLTRQEVNAAVKKYLTPRNMVIALVSQDADALAKALVEDTPSPMSYATPKPAAVLAEDKEIQAYPLGIGKKAIRILPVEEVFSR